MREYKYYLNHRNSVNKYGKLSESMKMSREEALLLSETLRRQNHERKMFLISWELKAKDHIDEHLDPRNK